MKIDLANYAFLLDIPQVTRTNLTSSLHLGKYYIIESYIYPNNDVYVQVVERYKSVFKLNDNEFKNRYLPYGPPGGFLI